MAISSRATILVVFGYFGAVVGTHVGALPFLVANSGASPFLFGVAGTLGMAANIVAMALGGVINRHANHRSMLLLSLPLVFLVLCFAMAVNSVPALLLSFVLLSYSLGTLDIFMNAEGSIVEHQMGRPFFTTFHAVASLGIGFFAIVSSVISVFLAPWFGLLFAAALCALAWASVYKAIPARAPEQGNSTEAARPLPRRVLTFLGLAIGFNVACEVAAIFWAGQLLVAIAPELAAISGLGVAFYGLCSGVMRLLGDGLRARFGDVPMLVVCISLAVMGFAVLGFAPGFWLSVFAFAAVGIGLATTFPILFSLTGRLVPDARASAMGYVAAVSGAPRILLPTILGVLAAEFALGAVFATCAVVAAVALLIILFTYRQALARIPA